MAKDKACDGGGHAAVYAVRDQYPDLCCPHCGLWIGDTRDQMDDFRHAMETLTADDVLEITLLRAASIDHDIDDCADACEFLGGRTGLDTVEQYFDRRCQDDEPGESVPIEHWPEWEIEASGTGVSRTLTVLSPGTTAKELDHADDSARVLWEILKLFTGR